MAELGFSVKSQDDFPKWTRLASFFVGALILGDAVRKLFLPRTGDTGLTTVLALAVGAACLLITGYRRHIVLSEEGVVRETNVWGRKNAVLLIPAPDVRRAALYPIKGNRGAFLVLLASDLKTYRMTLPVSCVPELGRWILAHGSGVRLDDSRVGDVLTRP
jgi:hypothetical protein